MSREQIVELYLGGGMSRRTFVRRMVAAGLTVTAAISYAELLAPGEASAARGTDFYATDYPLPPDVVTELVTGVTPTAATLHATIDPNFHRCTIVFRWGTAADQLTGTVTVPGTVGTAGDPEGPNAGSGARDVSAPLSGLAAGTQYFVRAEATYTNGSIGGNPTSTILGNVTTFTGGITPVATPSPTPTTPVVGTPPPPPPPTPAPNASPTPVPVPTPNPDHTPPGVGLAILTRKRATLIKTGMQVNLTLNEPGTATVVIRDPRRRQLSKVGSGLATLPSGGAVTLTVQLSAGAKRKLRLGGKIRWTVLVTGTDATGNTKQVSVPFRLG